MKRERRICIGSALFGMAMFGFAPLALGQAESFPTRPVRLFVPFAAGGTADTTARLVAPGMTEALGQPVIVENRPGGGGILAADLVAKAAPDGYTLLVATSSFPPTPALYRKLPFDIARDFAPVTQLIATEFALVTNARLKLASVKELVALAKAKPGALNYGSSGVANPLHLAMELLKLSAGVDIQPIPYKGDGPLYQALIAGEVDVAVVGLAAVLPHIRAGRLSALAVTNTQRAATLPEVPTVAEQGFASIDTTGWHALFAPAKTPRPVIEAIQQAAARALASRESRERLAAQSQEAVASTPAAFDAKFRAEIAKYADIVKSSKIPWQD